MSECLQILGGFWLRVRGGSLVFSIAFAKLLFSELVYNINTVIDIFSDTLHTKLARKYGLKESDPILLQTTKSIEEGNIDFSKSVFRKFDGRIVTQYRELSPENITLLYLKGVLKRTFRVRFANRNKVIDGLFDALRTAQDLRDFTIARFDLKKYFYSISTKYIFDTYLVKSTMARREKDLFEQVISFHPYCVAGLPIFNYMIEIISRDFDAALTARLREYGVVYYSRYVDDGVVMFNKYVTKKEVRRIIDEVIEAVFKNKSSDNKVRLNLEKFTVINRRHITRIINNPLS